MTEFDEREERYIDRFLNASFSFWNSLIIFNSLLIGSISILFNLNSEISLYVVLPLFSFGVLSVTLLVWNFLVVKGVYYTILNMEDKHKDVPTEKLDPVLQKDIKKTLKQKTWIKIREITSLVFSAISLVYMFFTILVTSYK